MIEIIKWLLRAWLSNFAAIKKIFINMKKLPVDYKPRRLNKMNRSIPRQIFASFVNNSLNLAPTAKTAAIREKD